MTNPIGDTLSFPAGSIGDCHHLGSVRYVLVPLYLGVPAARLHVARRSWQEDPAQRGVRNVAAFAKRFVAGGMWFQRTIWKLPPPVSAGFTYWLTQEGKHSAVPTLGALVRDVLRPNIALLQPLVYLLGIFFAVSLTLGFAVRLTGTLAALFTLQLWIGLHNDPTEWPWTHVAIIRPA